MLLNNNDVLKTAKDALDKAIETEKRNKKLLESIGPSIISALSPLFSELKGAISKLKVDVSPVVQVNPEVKIPPINIPPIQYTPPDVIVNYTPPKIDVPPVKVDLSSIKIPDLVWPKGDMPITGRVSLSNVDLNNPLPVQIRDAKGNPVTLGGSGGAAVISGGGGGFQNVNATIVGANGSIAAALVDSSGVQYSGSNPLPITGSLSTTPGATFFASDAVLSVNVIQSFGNNTPVGGGYQDNALRVVHSTDAVVSVNIVGENQTLEVLQVSGAVNSVNLLQIAGNSAVVGTGYQDNALRVVHATDAVTSVNNTQWNGNAITVGTGYQDNALRVVNATDAITSVNITGAIGTISANIVDSGGVVYSGSNPVPVGGTLTAVTSITNSVAAYLVDSGGVGYNGANALPVYMAKIATATTSVNLVDSTGVAFEGANPVPVYMAGTATATSSVNVVDSTGVPFEGANPFPITIVTSQTASVNASLIDSSGVGYSGANPVPITIVSGALTSTLAVGDSAARSADNGGNPVKVGGIARQTNPTAYADGDRANFAQDDLGRQLVRPVQVRDLTLTAYATFATGTEATLYSAAAGTYADLIYILASNNSTAAVGVDIRPSTAGSIVMHLEIPANGVVGVSTPVPIPQQVTGDGTGGSWTVDLPDITGTTVSVSALFSKEI